MRRVIVLMMLPMLQACDVFGPVDCTTSWEPALVVHIADAVTGEPRAAGASGFVQDGEYTDSLAASHFNGEGVMTARQAAGERAGLYDITVAHPGYETWRRDDVRVRDGECHVQTRHIDADLTPADAS